MPSHDVLCDGQAVVDAHHHLWDLDVCHYPWLMARGVKRFFGDPTPIQKNYLVGDFLADAGDVALAASVHVQVGVAEEDAVKETAWLQQTASEPDSHGMPHAIVGFCDLSAPDAAAVIDAHCAYENLRGLRQIVGRAPAEDAVTNSGALLDNPRWIENLGLLVDRGLSFDLQLIPPQIPRAASVLADIPELRVAVCHCGSPWDQSREGLARWSESMAELAELPNVFCKLSGFGMLDPQWSAASIRPIVDVAIEMFSASRSMFGSNFPVEKLVRGYTSVWADYDAATADRCEAEREQLFFGTANEFYRLGLKR